MTLEPEMARKVEQINRGMNIAAIAGVLLAAVLTVPLGRSACFLGRDPIFQQGTKPGPSAGQLQEKCWRCGNPATFRQPPRYVDKTTPAWDSSNLLPENQVTYACDRHTFSLTGRPGPYVAVFFLVVITRTSRNQTGFNAPSARNSKQAKQ